VLELLAAKLECSLSYLVNGVTAEQMEEIELELGYARMALENGEVTEARRRYADLVADNNLAGLAELRQDAEFGLALAMEACGDLDAAVATLNGLRAAAGDQMTPERLIAVAIALSRCYRERGDLAAAVQVGEQILSGPARPAWTDELVELGATLLAAYNSRRDLLRARHFSAELLAAAELLGSPRATVAACWNGAMVAEAYGLGEESLALAAKALAVHSENGEPRNLARVRLAYTCLRMRIRPEQVDSCREELVRSQRELAESSAGTTDRARCELELSRVEFTLGHLDAAVSHAAAARDLLSSSTKGLTADAHLLLGGAFAMLGRTEEAQDAIGAASQWLDQVSPARRAAEGWCTAAEVLGRLDDRRGSVEAYQKALASVGL
jgi:tetratricopeptide (TPR) repeat protein